jgi:peptidoglycan/xylan/chitin deacetylase (PgdA/CDA1 family)
VLKSMLHSAADLAPRGVLVRRGPKELPRVALTFDDGPDEMTTKYLDLLDRFGVTATFFVIGTACARFPAVLREIVARGHEVASHGHTHTLFPKLSGSALTAELASVQELIPPPERRRPFVRPPRGAVTPATVLRCASLGYTTVLWSLDSDDCRTTSPGEVAARVATSQAGEIVLMHEGQQWTLDALPTIIPALLDRGMDLVTVGTMLG